MDSKSVNTASPSSRSQNPFAILGAFAAKQYQIVLALIIVYQAVIYMWVSRAYIHVTGVLFPWLLTQPGYRLYENINVSYAPVYIWFNTAFMQLIPDHPLRLRIGTIIIATLITLLLFVQARRWWNIQIGLLAALLFAAWGPFMLGYMMYFEFILGLLSLGAIMIWYDDSHVWWRPFAAGLLIGLAIVIKQQALAIIIILFIWRLALSDWKAALRDILYFSLGVMIPIGIVGGILAAQGVLNRGLFLMTAYNRPRISLGIQFPDLTNILILALWFGLAPWFILYTFRERPRFRLQRLLLLGMIFALSVPAFPRYGRFHLAGALPFVSLMSAGTMYDLFRIRRIPVVRAYGVVVLFTILIFGVSVPILYYYFLGSQDRQYQALVPVSEWVKEETDAPVGTRIWILPDTDPTGNFYPISGYLPPSFYSNTYSLWFQTWPETSQRVIAALESDPPQYVLIVDEWRSEIPEVLQNYVDENYQAVAESELFKSLGQIILYRHEA